MNINKHTKIFIKNIMLGVGNVHLSLLNRYHVLAAVKKAYITMEPRTLGRGKPQGAKIDVNLKERALRCLALEFVNYFKAPAPQSQADFDNWHRNICNKFIVCFDKVLAKSGYVQRMTYGKAQKIVNISFKYLYLFCNIEEGANGHFRFCHMAIDGIILDWYKNKVDPNCKCDNWSDLSEKEYFDIQDIIRNNFSSNENVFLSEFEIWSDLRYGKLPDDDGSDPQWDCSDCI